MTTSIYFDIVTENNSFYIAELQQKPSGRHSAVTTLEKISRILDQNRPYSKAHNSASTQTSEDVQLRLKEISDAIAQGYAKKHENYMRSHCWITRIFTKIFSKANHITRLTASIARALPTYSVVDRPSRNIKPESKASSPVSQQSNDTVRKAQDFGYEGVDPTQAQNYLETLFEQTETAWTKGYFSEDCAKFDEETFNPEATLKALTTKNRIYVLGNLISNSDLTLLKKCVLSRRRPVVPASPMYKTLTKMNDITRSAVERGDHTVLPFLIDCGNDLDSMLEDAIECGADKTVAYLLDESAKKEERRDRATTALGFACRFDHHGVDRSKVTPKLIKTLLERGANPNLPYQNGETPLSIALRYNKKEIADTLRQFGAKDLPVNSTQTSCASV